MTSWSQIYPKPSRLIKNFWFREPGSQSFTVPNDVRYKWMVAIVQGCGGMGETYGGGGALAKSKRTVTPGEVLSLQTGSVSTASVLGDSFVRRSNNTIIAYADRGRGNGAAGLASNSTGDLKRDGIAGVFGNPSSDLTDLLSMGFGGMGFYEAQIFRGQAPDAGGGGMLVPTYYQDGTWDGSYVSHGAGTGTVLLQFYDADPGALAW